VIEEARANTRRRELLAAKMNNITANKSKEESKQKLQVQAEERKPLANVYQKQVE